MTEEMLSKTAKIFSDAARKYEPIKAQLKALEFPYR